VGQATYVLLLTSRLVFSVLLVLDRVNNGNGLFLMVGFLSPPHLCGRIMDGVSSLDFILD